MNDLLDVSLLLNTYIIPWGLKIITAAAIFYIGRTAKNILIKLLQHALDRAKVDHILSNFVLSIISAILLLFIIIASLDQLGVDTTSLIAVIGAAGLAVGLALQNSLQNFSAGVLLIIFRPFKNGDFVDAGGATGIVEQINVFSTTMRTVDNREVIVPNAQIYTGIITNYSARPTRRLDLVFGISYGDDMKLAKTVIWEALQADPRVLKDPEATVAVGELGDSSVNFYVRPWVTTADYWALKFALTEDIKARFDQVGISIPFPQMDVHLKRDEDTLTIAHRKAPAIGPAKPHPSGGAHTAADDSQEDATH